VFVANPRTVAALTSELQPGQSDSPTSDVRTEPTRFVLCSTLELNDTQRMERWREWGRMQPECDLSST